MATGLQRKPLPRPKYDTFVAQQLDKTERRIRALDVGSSLLWLGIVVSGYAFVMALLDHTFILAVGMRVAGLFSFALFGSYFLGQAGLRLYRRINPYYTARQLEQTLPNAKNSVVNWLDLHEEKLPPVVRSALSQQAAKDLRQTDAEQAVSGQQTWWLAAVLAILFTGLMVLFVAGPSHFGSLLNRAFVPFYDIAQATRTTIRLLQPADGDTVVGLHQRVEFRAHIEGRFPRLNQEGSPRLYYRYHPQDTYVSQALEEETDGNWGTSLHPDQVQNGFWYKISAGDTETPEYQVRVHLQPLATRFEITYRYRPYLHAPEQTITFPNQQAVFPRIRGHRGTEVTLTAWANRNLRDGHLHLTTGQSKKVVIGDLLPDAADAVRFRFVLDQGGSFQLFFTSKEGENNTDRSPYPIEVIPDTVPRVVLTKPGEDVKLPANGTLALEGSATDDFGIKGLTLRLKVLEGTTRPNLEPKPYRPGKSFQFHNGTFPDHLAYLDVLALEKLKTAAGKNFPLNPGMVLEYWLEAVDNCDYPDKNGNLGKSQAFKVTIVEPEKDQQKQQQERQKTEEQQQQHQKKQDDELAKQNAKKQQEEANKGPNQQKQQPQDNAEQQKQEQELDQKGKELKDKADRLKKEIDKQEQAKKDKGEGKGEDGPNAEAKKNGEEKDKKGGESKGSKADQQQTGQPKDKGQDQKQPTGQAKDEGQPPPKQPENQPGQAKNTGQDKKEAGPKDTASKNDSNNLKNGQPKTSPEGGKQPPQNQPATAKDQGKADPKEGQGVAKKEEPAPGEMKPGQAKAEEAKGEAKNSDQPQGKEGQAKPAAKEGGAKQGPPRADSKPGPGQGDSKPGLAKDEGTSPDQGPNTGQRKEPTLDDIARLHKEAQGADPKTKDDARQILERLAKDAQDPNVQQAAKEALKKADEKNGPGAEKVNPNERTAKEGGQEGPGPATKGTQKGEEKPGTAQGEEAGKGKAPETAKGEPSKGDPKDTEKGDPHKGGRTGNTGPGGKGIEDDPKASLVDKAAARRGGELSLENLKKKITPDILQKAGLTDKDWQQFLKDYQAYEDLRQKLARQAKERDTLRGDPTLLPGAAPRKVGSGPDAKADPLQTGQALPPPEFRELYRRFTSSPAVTRPPANKK